ncbi:MFS transporter [Kitasatospora sp. NPDC088346]|uniref:MFS transporter n=1 Tax=Kitasatospora sp. NPDC088346 TaxID=3364073 RepID=UPI003819B2E6
MTTGRTAPAPAVTGPDRWPLVGLAGLLAFVAMLDLNIVTVAVPKIAEGLGVQPETAQWAGLGYQLPVVALLLPVGRWLDGVAPRHALLGALTGFALCSAAAAAAPGAGWLIGARIAQGCFAAVLFVLMPVLAATAVRPELRARAMSVPATLGPLGAVTGPAVGGLLLDHLGWRAVFLVKLPLCLAAAVLAHRHLAPGGRTPRPDRRSSADAALIGAAVGAVLLALTLAPGAPPWLLLALAAVPFAVLWLRGPGGRTVVAVLRYSATSGVNAAVLAVAAGFAAMHYLVSLHLQRDQGVSATATGLTVLAFPAAMGLAGPLGGRLADCFGTRPTAAAGAAVTALGLLLLVPLGDHWSTGSIAWRLALAGAGMGLYGGPSQALVMTAAPPDRMATAGSTVQLARSLGFALGPALATAAWGLAGRGDTGVRTGLAVAAVAVCAAVPLLAAGARVPRPARPGRPTAG